MTYRKRGLAPFAFALILGAAPANPIAETATVGQSPSPSLTLDVSHRARSVAPGEVVVVGVQASIPLTKVDGRTPAGAIRFFQTADPRVWEALVGLDMNTAKGPFRIAVSAAAGELRAEKAHTLTVKPKTFSSRRITVAQAYATPPKSALARIQRESKRVGGILAAVSEARLWASPFAAPVPGGVTSAFGHRSIVNGQARSPHGGVDLRAGEGAPVRAPNGGRIVLSDDLYYSGQTVIIDHGLGLFSYMGHLSKRNVSEGDVVARGDLVGLAGSTGRVTGPHLHWTVRLAGARVDPMSLLAVMGEK